MIKYILCDIEGTTTSVSFVYDELFPYFTNNLIDFINANKTNEIVTKCIKEVQQTVLEEENKHISDKEATQVLLDWTKNDRKHTSLKKLQGYVWKEGYEKGAIKGHIYEDVKPTFEKWIKEGKQIGIYSSGSVQAQKLLFGTSKDGNLLPFLSHHFDTNIGNKKDKKSYTNIIKELGISANQVLFLSDVEAELDAAKITGLETIQLVRTGTTPSPKHKNATNFFEINI